VRRRQAAPLQTKTEITVAQAKFREIMSWEDWKAKARSLAHRCSQCGAVRRQDAGDGGSANGLCAACATKAADNRAGRAEVVN
jgi:uncharacterized paraquat-inducible protein A